MEDQKLQGNRGEEDVGIEETQWVSIGKSVNLKKKADDFFLNNMGNGNSRKYEVMMGNLEGRHMEEKVGLEVGANTNWAAHCENNISNGPVLETIGTVLEKQYGLEDNWLKLNVTTQIRL
ncbi:hypothetical protein L6452_31159 [Arctium lappa]|uniref:Uncharacterized protein n=1 Tax=Arctium lappa TaxID=4217 RepID=A0ACB8ZL58_ARCLA|nr:hypothetical protein L6452_31159 [Arctium lappa]